MKVSKLFAGVIASATALAVLTSSVAAYDFGNKDLGKNWSINAQVPASEFADLTADSYVTVTYETDKTETEYWSIKPMVALDSWTFIDPKGEGGPELSEAKDAYPVDVDSDSITFKVPADFIDAAKQGGLIFMGHSITLKTLTVSKEAPSTSEPSATVTEASGTGSVNGSTNDKTDDKTNAPNTGVEGVAVLAGVGFLAAAAVLLTKKRK